VTVNGRADLDVLLCATRHVLLDFDGPICSIFANVPAPSVAARLRAMLRAAGVSEAVVGDDEDDPIAVFRSTSKLDPSLAARIESALSAAEVSASRTADPTPHVDAFLLACRHAGRSVAVVSNNAEPAVRSYLTAHGLIERVGPVIGRTVPNPALLKPSPHLVKRAIDLLGADPAACTMIGDSVSDIESARAAGARSIGYANDPREREHLWSAGADAVIGSLAELLR
jgi:HAD superfamily hydrolase (TIGR01509 family)